MNLRGFARTEFPARVKAEAFRRCCDDKGVPHCENCNTPLTAGNTIFEHIQADGLDGQPTLQNCRVYCKTCAQKKTVEHDNPIMQKADRVLKRAFGIRNRKGRPMPGTKASGWKQKFGTNEWVRRD